MIQPVILSGGSGTRLWPLSREQMPKQFLRLTGEQSLLQQTLTRLEGLTTLPPMLIGHHSHRFLMAEQLREVQQKGQIVVGHFADEVRVMSAFSRHRQMRAFEVDADDTCDFLRDRLGHRVDCRAGSRGRVGDERG